MFDRGKERCWKEEERESERERVGILERRKWRKRK